MKKSILMFLIVSFFEGVLYAPDPRAAAAPRTTNPKYFLAVANQRIAPGSYCAKKFFMAQKSPVCAFPFLSDQYYYSYEGRHGGWAKKPSTAFESPSTISSIRLYSKDEIEEAFVFGHYIAMIFSASTVLATLEKKDSRLHVTGNEGDTIFIHICFRDEADMVCVEQVQGHMITSPLFLKAVDLAIESKKAELESKKVELKHEPKMPLRDIFPALLPVLLADSSYPEDRVSGDILEMNALYRLKFLVIDKTALENQQLLCESILPCSTISTVSRDKFMSADLIK